LILRRVHDKRYEDIMRKSLRNFYEEQSANLMKLQRTKQIWTVESRGTHGGVRLIQRKCTLEENGRCAARTAEG
jgi:hypothetical protein